ncbi:peptidyl-prolyl cis-trans isomerase FKBP43-like [Papaver somniferum]|uniref:peptidyl-prolyl cis-trans isomerase FKBP43-like n=1 Tax=Papaver somniferum TaxID=3469 RepID=UPI000E6FB927|nr:peptidyl-prolyl cis-trans isomerase FKBP43-like [Papaver somniferum]
MTIWGVELEPGETFTYRFNKANGKLHISQLTPGKIIDDDCLDDVVELKCEVGDGDQTPIVLCRFSYMRQRVSSYALNYEFGEDDGGSPFMLLAITVFIFLVIFLAKVMVVEIMVQLKR